MNKKILSKMLATTILLGGLNFAPLDFQKNLQIVSVAQAKVETFEGQGAYPITNDKTHGEVKELSKNEAIRDALEKAGVAIYREVQVENNILTKDVIKKQSGAILKILSDKYIFIPAYKDNSVGIYKATVTISIDTDELNKNLQEFLKVESATQSSQIYRYKELQKLYDANTKKIAELEKQLADKNFTKNSQQIKNEIAEIDKNNLYAQKIDEGWQTYENGNFETALKFFDDAVKINPNDYQGYYGRGFDYDDLQNYEQAISDYNQAIKLNPNNESIYNNRGVTYYNLKNYSQAIEDFTQAIKLNQNFEKSYYNLGLVYDELKNYTQAIENYTQAIKLNSTNADSYHNRGLDYVYLKNYEQAIKNFSKAIELNPEFLAAYLNIGYSYNELKNYEQAMKYYNEGIQKITNDSAKMTVTYLYGNRGILYAKIKKYDLAMKDLQEAVQLETDDGEVYYYRGICNREFGNNSQAEADFAKAKELGYNS